MNAIKRYYAYISEGIFLIFIFFVSQLPLRDFDIWFHLKSGELFISQKALQFTEVFSFTAQGRNWTPFEWLFQIIVYLMSQWWGLAVIPFFIAIFVVLTQFFFLRILDYIFGIKLIPRLIFVFIFFVSTYEFNTARPHVLAYSFFIISLFLIFARVFRHKKWVFFSPLITLVWTNVHSTGFLSWGLFLTFGFIALLQWLFTKEKDSLRQVRDFFILSMVNFLITISPPMGFRDYQLLWHFFTNREFLGHFIAEWSPTTDTDNLFGVYVYSAFLTTAVISFIALSIKNRVIVKNLWGVPLIIIGILGYSATRNVFLGMFAILLLLAASSKYLMEWIPKWRFLVIGKQNLIWIILAVLLVGFHGRLFVEKQRLVAGERRYYPVQSTEFVKRYLTGNMFNDYTYGGYILYNVYPSLKVFIDGRADVYLCCEMQDYLLLAINKRMDDQKYREFLNLFWDEYKINFAIISTQKHNVMRRIARLLNTDPKWALVFWDDDSQVFVKRDGVNDKVIEQLDAKYATPYLRNLYVEGKADEALLEYERLDKIAKSARTANAIGFIMLQKGQFDQAYERFTEALNQDPTFESPYMNLAELAVKEGNIQAAVGLYKKALSLSRDRGLIYIRLGELILQQTDDKNQVKKIWEDGIKNTVDEDAREKLKELLSTL